MHHEQGARRPQPGLVPVREHIGAGDAERGENAERGEVVRQNARRQPPGDPPENARLGFGE
jgi:hypothetical protein